MRNAINKDFFREIKYTLNRYVSILLIVALGVAFLAGIRATCPDMKLTLDHYLDEADYMDLRVLSTLGLTGEDLTAIAEVDGVKEVDGAHSYDAFVMNGNEKWTLRFLSEPVSVNKLEITEGRDIENANECVVDHLLIEKDGYHIGDQITVVPPGKGEKLSDPLTESTFTCVRGFPYGRLYASRMDDTAETQVDQPCQRHDRQHRQCREPAMSSTSVMIAICFAPKERASLLVRSVAWVVLLSCCMIVC